MAARLTLADFLTGGGNVALGDPTITPGGQVVGGGPMSPAPPDDALRVLGALIETGMQRANEQAARVPGTSRIAALGRRGSQALHAWAAAPQDKPGAPGGMGSPRDVRQTREALARMYDLFVPQDEVGSVIAAFPPIRGLRVGQSTVERIGKGPNMGSIRAKKQLITRSGAGSRPINPDTFTQFLSRYEDDIGIPVTRIYSSGVPEELRGTGEGIKAYMRLANESLEAGMPLVSDTVLSRDSQAIYKALRKRGYTVVENPNYFVEEGFRISKNDMPLFRVEAKPMLPAVAESARPQSRGNLELKLANELRDASTDDAVDMIVELEKQGFLSPLPRPSDDEVQRAFRAATPVPGPERRR